MRRILSLVMFMSVCAPLSFAHDGSHFDEKQEISVKTTKAGGNVYMLQGRGGNVGALVGSDGILIVDDDYKVVSEKLREALMKLGSDKPRFIFNTHWHGDHTEGNLVFGKDAIIIAQTNVRTRLSQINKIFGEIVQPYPDYALPMITFNESMSINFDGEEVRAVHYPNGHTDGDSVIFFPKSNVVHLGDHFFAGRFPFVDLENGGNVQGLINNVGMLIKQIPADAKLIPGHGGISTLDDLKNYHQMLSESTEIVQKAMKKKKTLDEIKKAGLPDKFKDYGSGFIKTEMWLETVYKSYTVNKK